MTILAVKTAQDAMAPQLLIQRPADPSGAVARALQLSALAQGAAAHRLRPQAEEGEDVGTPDGEILILRWLKIQRKILINIVQ